ncbi:cell death protein 3-like isoform X1 [Haliotis rufescens]|uniref:cell death protein 3-like isoform X1 n=1 Tax=Haliotis rufescens TaxID=6454 RepID=UPI00201E8299|nr:cell death protein 3-like isoform X1 [Haliotis rufescens]
MSNRASGGRYQEDRSRDHGSRNRDHSPRFREHRSKSRDKDSQPRDQDVHSRKGSRSRDHSYETIDRLPSAYSSSDDYTSSRAKDRIPTSYNDKSRRTHRILPQTYSSSDDYTSSQTSDQIPSMNHLKLRRPEIIALQSYTSSSDDYTSGERLRRSEHRGSRPRDRTPQMYDRVPLRYNDSTPERWKGEDAVQHRRSGSRDRVGRNRDGNLRDHAYLSRSRDDVIRVSMPYIHDRETQSRDDLHRVGNSTIKSKDRSSHSRGEFHKKSDSASHSQELPNRSRDSVDRTRANQAHPQERSNKTRKEVDRIKDNPTKSQVKSSKTQNDVGPSKDSKASSKSRLGRKKDPKRVKPKISRSQEILPEPRDHSAPRWDYYLQSDKYGSHTTLSTVSGEKKNVRPGAPSEPNEYNFNYKRRGLFLIINNKNFHPNTGQQTREGTDVDAERLEERFQDLGFEVKRYDDVNRSRISTLMYDAAAYDHSNADCFGCAILSHGLEGRVYATDGYISLELLVMPFKGDRCPSLVGKPKLFFLQACRGTKMDYGVDVSDSSLSSKDEDEMDAANSVSIRKIPIEADFLFAYSTVPGYYSWRNNQDGSWFIQALCIVLENYGLKMELLHMLTHVNRIVAYEFASCTDREFTDKMKQMPCVVSMLTRYVFFRHKKQDIR